MILIPYTHYEFRPPPSITQSDFESLKSIDRIALNQLLSATGERERRAFVEARPVVHALTMFTFLVLIVSMVIGVLFLGAVYFTGRDTDLPLVSATWEYVLFAFFVSFFFAAVVFRSYAHTYSSFRNFLAARQSFYVRLKRQIDSTPAFDVFVYNPRMNVPLVRLLSWLRSIA